MSEENQETTEAPISSEDLERSNGKIEDILGAINREIEAEEIDFFGHTVISTECVWYSLILRGTSKGRPPRIMECSCDRFPLEKDICTAIADTDGIEGKLKARRFSNSHGAWIVDCEFKYRKSDTDKTIYSLVIKPEVSLTTDSATNDALDFVKASMAIVKIERDAIKQQLDYERKEHLRQIQEQKTFYESQITSERKLLQEALAAERALMDKRLVTYEKFMENMQKVLTTAVEQKVGLTGTDKHLAALQGDLVKAYQEALMKGDGADKGLLEQLTQGITVISTVGKGIEQIGKTFGLGTPNAPLPGSSAIPVLSATATAK